MENGALEPQRRAQRRTCRPRDPHPRVYNAPLGSWAERSVGGAAFSSLNGSGQLRHFGDRPLQALIRCPSSFFRGGYIGTNRQAIMKGLYLGVGFFGEIFDTLGVKMETNRLHRRRPRGPVGHETGLQNPRPPKMRCEVMNRRSGDGALGPPTHIAGLLPCVGPNTQDVRR